MATKRESELRSPYSKTSTLVCTVLSRVSIETEREKKLK
jgi:hypothetical protein